MAEVGKGRLAGEFQRQDESPMLTDIKITPESLPYKSSSGIVVAPLHFRKSPLDVELPEGIYLVRVFVPGFVREESRVEITAGATTYLPAVVGSSGGTKKMASIVLPDNALYSSLDDTITLRAASQDDDTFTIGS